MSTENNNALIEESLKKIDEASDYLLKSNSMSGEYVQHSLRSMQHMYLNEKSTLSDLNALLEKYAVIDLKQCKEFDDVLFKYGIDIKEFTTVWNRYFIKYSNQLEAYDIARLVDVVLCDNTDGFPMKMCLKEEYRLMDQTTKLVDLYKKEAILTKN